MNARTLLIFWFLAVFAAMVAVTTWASLDLDVLTAGRELWAVPWGRATLFDAYFAFVAVWLWVAHRESSWTARLAWLAAFFLLGNLAISAYFLLALRRASASTPLASLFGPRPGAAR